MSINTSRLSKKVPHVDNRKTLIAIHEKKMKEFEDLNNSLPEKKMQLESLNQKLKNLRNLTIDEEIKLKKEIENLKVIIFDITNKISETEYYIKSSQFIKDYTLESGNREVHNKGEISQKYVQECLSDGFSFSDKSIYTNELFCFTCKISKEINYKEALAVCRKCGSASAYQDSDTCNEFSEEIEVLSPFSYKRINHFKEWISMLLARESSSPPEETINKLLLELKKDCVRSRDQVTPERIRGYLKKLGLNKQYEHTSSIIHKICGTSPPNISKELESQLIFMFESMQGPYEKHKPPNRKNFLSYAYVLHKLCEILGQTHLLKSFPLLKSREKLCEQDITMRLICADLGWPFYPSL